jgi:hypothetical protein
MRNIFYTSADLSTPKSLSPSARVHFMPAADWHMALARAVGEAQDSDIIVINSISKERLAQSALERGASGKQVNLLVLSPEANEGATNEVNLTPQATLALQIMAKGYGDKIDREVLANLHEEVRLIVAGVDERTRVAAIQKRYQDRARLELM